MEHTSVRPAGDVEQVVERYGDQIYRICLITLKNRADAEDAVQDTLIKYMQKAPCFASAEHEKAWLVRVAVNHCRDLLRRRRDTVDIDTLLIADVGIEEQFAMDALLSLPDQYRAVLTLHYVMGYSTKEIGKIIGKTSSAVKMRLQKGRKLLEEALGKEQSL